MSLTSGVRVGPYEILEPAGAGGMGEVFRARDVRLERQVAVKTVKGPFTERFEREACAISALTRLGRSKRKQTPLMEEPSD